jgi:uncharacterized repeat protein (TIGR01451 family)
MSSSGGTSATISGTPTVAGPYSYTVQATDNFSLSASEDFSGTLNPASAIDCTPLTGPLEVGIAYTATCKASSGSMPFSWTVQGLPGGLALTSSGANATISGTPTAAGPYSYTVQVADQLQSSRTRIYTGAINERPALNCNPATGPPQAGVFYSSNCTVSGGTAPYSWQIASGVLPAGLSLSATTGPSTIVSGTPTASGAYNFTVQLTDSLQATATQVYANKINLTISVSCTTSSDLLEVGVAYTSTCTVSGGTAPYTWSVSQGALAPGLALSGTAGAGITISGQPAAAAPFSYTIQVKDALFASATQLFGGQVVGVPAVNCQPTAGPAQVGVFYTATCTVADGTPPYKWAISQGTLPGGLVLGPAAGGSTTIAGTPKLDGPYQYTVQVNDNLTVAATQSYSGTIAAPNEPLQIFSTPGSDHFAVDGTANYTLTINNLGRDAVSGTVTVTETLPLGFANPSSTGTDPSWACAINQQLITCTRSGQLAPGNSFPPILVQATVTNDACSATGSVSDAASIFLNGQTENTAQSSVPITGCLSITPAQIDFGTVQSQQNLSLERLVTVTSQDLNAIFNFSVAPNGSPFSVGSTACHVLPTSGQSCTVTVAFNPVCPGLQNATLQIIKASGQPVPIPITAVVTPSTGTFSFSPALPADGTLAPGAQYAVNFALQPALCSGQTLGLTPSFTPATGIAPDVITTGKTFDFSVVNNAGGAFYIQAGTVASQVQLTAQINGQALLFSGNPLMLSVPARKGVIANVTLGTQAAASFQVNVQAYSTPRESGNTQLCFAFTAANGAVLQADSQDCVLQQEIGNWYERTSSYAFGSQFAAGVTFPFSGDKAAIGTIKVVLRNSSGDSDPYCVDFKSGNKVACP